MNKIVQIIIVLCFYLSVNAQPFRFIVAADGSGDFTNVQSAIDASPDNERSIIFIKNGNYYGQTYIGSKAVSSLKLISLIGESRENVILTYDKSLNMVTTFEEATTFQIYAKNFYAENITFANSAGNTGQALALFTAGDMATFRNCYITGYQDTYRSKKGTRGYFKNCIIEGAVDFIYAGGVEFFDDCQINCVKGGGYIVAPEDAYITIPKTQTTIGQFIRVGFFFRNCTITRNSDVADNSYVLGRPWQDYSGTVFLNCKMDKHIKPAGWLSSGTVTTDFYAEYNSMDLSGNPLDVSGRVSWSYQLPKADVDNILTLSGIFARVNTSVTYDPIGLLNSANAPANVQVNNNNVNWSPSENTIGYLIYKGDKFLGYTTLTSFTDESNLSGEFGVKSITAVGVLSSMTTRSTGTLNLEPNKIKFRINNNEINFSENVTVLMYNAAGELISKNPEFKNQYNIGRLKNGLYIGKAINQLNESVVFKFIQK